MQFDEFLFPEVAEIEEIQEQESELREMIPQYSMRYHNITKDDMLNGDGLGVVLWVAGCEHHCAYCHNPVTWDPNDGLPFTSWDESEIFDWFKNSWISRITFSGGDPLHPHNRKDIGTLARKCKKLYPEKKVWLYTGYVLKAENDNFYFENADGDTFTIDYLDCIDVIVDGRFEIEVRNSDLKANKEVHWRGSSNQRVIDVQSSLLASKVIEMPE